MLTMLIVSEILWWVMFFIIYGTGAMVGWRLVHLMVTNAPKGMPLATHIATPLAIVIALPISVLAMCFVAGLMSRLLPRLKPGNYGKKDTTMQLAWGLRYLLTRVLFLGPMLPFIQFSLFLRWFAWRALGADVELGSMMSSDIPLPDMPLIRAARGSLIGSRSRLSTHLMTGGKLTLGMIELGEGAVVGGDCNISPNVMIGEKSVLSFSVLVAQDVTIGKNVFVGKLVRIGSNVTIGDGAVVETESKIPNGTVIPPGGRWVNPKEDRLVGRLEEPAEPTEPAEKA